MTLINGQFYQQVISFLQSQVLLQQICQILLHLEMSTKFIYWMYNHQLHRF